MTEPEALDVEGWTEALDASSVFDMMGEDTGPDYDPSDEPDDDDE